MIVVERVINYYHAVVVSCNRAVVRKAGKLKENRTSLNFYLSKFSKTYPYVRLKHLEIL